MHIKCEGQSVHVCSFAGQIHKMCFFPCVSKQTSAGLSVAAPGTQEAILDVVGCDEASVLYCEGGDTLLFAVVVVLSLNKSTDFSR